MIRIGTSGWSYKHWRGKFYPEKLPQVKWLEYFSKYFDTVEINSSFYHIPKETVTSGWQKKTPADFLFSVKMSRLISHVHKLKNVDKTLEWFLSSIAPLSNKIVAILIQLPPSFCPDHERLAYFFEILSKKESEIKTYYNYVIEIRNPNCYSTSLIDTLKKHNVSLCFHDFGNSLNPKIAPLNDYITSKLIYIRFHGYGRIYGGNYPNETLKAWSEIILRWHKKNLDILAYFNNDAEGYAIQNAETLKNYVQNSN